MTFPPIPASHSVGDTGHTADHDSIVAVLNAFLTSIQSLQGTAVNITYTTGGNTSDISGTSTSWNRINLPSGNRDTAADTFDVWYGSAKIFSLNGYGELRLFPAAATHIPQIIQGITGQTGDLEQWQNAAGSILCRIAADGSIVTPVIRAWDPRTGAPTVETWHSLSLQNGVTNRSPSTDFSPFAIKLGAGSCVYTTGQINIPANTANGTQIAVLPSSVYHPIKEHQIVVTSTQAPANLASLPRLVIEASGSMQVFGGGSASAIWCCDGSYPLDI